MSMLWVICGLNSTLCLKILIRTFWPTMAWLFYHVHHLGKPQPCVLSLFWTSGTTGTWPQQNKFPPVPAPWPVARVLLHSESPAPPALAPWPTARVQLPCSGTLASPASPAPIPLVASTAAPTKIHYKPAPWPKPRDQLLWPSPPAPGHPAKHTLAPTPAPKWMPTPHFPPKKVQFPLQSQFSN